MLQTMLLPAQAIAAGRHRYFDTQGLRPRRIWGIRTIRFYNDWDGVEELTHLPDHAFHRKRR